MLVWLLCAINIISFSCLAAAMSKHQRDFFGRALEARQNRLLAAAGWLLLALSMFASAIAKGPSVGISTWVCAITFSALVVGLVATYLPLRLKTVNAVAALLSGLLVSGLLLGGYLLG